MSWGKTDQESRLDAVFAGLEADFKRLDKARDPAKAQALLKDVTAKLKDAKACVCLITSVLRKQHQVCSP
jgi:hypothetical protein